MSFPRRAKSTPRAANSASRCPAPQPRTTRPPESASSVRNALAVASGWRYAGIHTYDMRRTCLVAAARNPSVAIGSYQMVDMAAACERGTATWSQAAT